MSLESKIENLRKNIEAIDRKVEELSQQRKLYQMALDKKILAQEQKEKNSSEA